MCQQEQPQRQSSVTRQNRPAAMAHSLGCSFLAFKNREIERPSPEIYPPRGPIPTVVDINDCTSIWTSTVGHPEVAILFQQRVARRWRLPGNVAGIIASFTSTPVFFLKCDSGLSPYWLDELPSTASIDILCICSQHEDHAEAMLNTLFLSPTPADDFQGFMHRINYAGRPWGARSLVFHYYGSTLLVIPN